MPLPMMAACVPPMAEVELLLQYYLEGTELAPWISGFSGGDGSQSKQADHLYCAVGPSAGAGPHHRAYVTQNGIDLTPFSTLFVDWAVIRPIGGSAAFGVATNRDDDSFVASLSKNTTGTRAEESIDVSALSGVHYLKLRSMRAGSLATATEAFFYGVRLAP